MSRQFHFARPDGSRIEASHYRTSRPDDEHKRYGAGDVGDLPPRVDLRPYMTPIEDQQQTSSCVANATAGAYEYLVKQHADEPYDVSRLFIYFNGRREESSDIEDAGVCIEDVVKGLRDYGACSEETWPFDEDLVNERPSSEAYEEASSFLVEDVHVVPTELDAWKGALAEGYPIIFGISLFKSFDKHRKPGLVPLPSPSEASRASHGGHAMLCVGYSDADEVFIVRNSWGADWGDDGYCYIPYDYIMNEDYNDGDSWIIRRLDALPDGQQHWVHDDDSVLEEIDGEIANMDDDAFTALTDACGDVHFETRVAALFLIGAGADGDISDTEANEVASYVQTVLDALGLRSSAVDILEHAAKLADQALIQETIGIFREHLSNEALAAMIGHLKTVADADGTSDDEQGLVDALVEAWQIEPSSSNESGDSAVDTTDADDTSDSSSEEDSSEEDSSEEDSSEEDSSEEDSSEEDSSEEDSSEEDSSDEDASEEDSSEEEPS